VEGGEQPMTGRPREEQNVKPKTSPWKYAPDPLFACEVASDGGVLAWMAFDPECGPESQAQIDWHRRQHGERFVRGWQVGLPLPGHHSSHARWQRDHGRRYFDDELPGELADKSEKPKSAALECGDSRNESRSTTPSTSAPLVTAASRNGGPPERRLCAADGCDRRVAVRRADARYCSAACKQRAYRERQMSLFEEAPAG
jgi:hypothetical protein